MWNRSSCFAIALLLALLSAQLVTAQEKADEIPAPKQTPAEPPAHRPTKEILEAKVKTEWEAFKNKNKKAYNDLLADDFMAVEDDGQGMRNKNRAAAEVDRSVIDKYYLFALSVVPLNSNSAFVTYELTMLFPPRAEVRLKRVLVSELWLKRDEKWKLRYYQETRVR